MPYIYGEWHPTKELRWLIRDLNHVRTDANGQSYASKPDAVLQQKFYCWDDGEKLVQPRREEWRDVPTVTEEANEVVVEKSEPPIGARVNSVEGDYPGWRLTDCEYNRVTQGCQPPPGGQRVLEYEYVGVTPWTREIST